ncbi:hypothetical protein Tco_0524004 [Tanacetum coccineum]
MPYPRFTKIIINHFLAKHNTLPKRQISFINTINYDSVLGKLKFVKKGEEHQTYGMSILVSMMNDEIRNSAQYMTYLALSTNTKKEKKKDAVKKKDDVPRMKRSLTGVDNILPNPNEAVKLDESISLIVAEHQDKERRLHETHTSLIIGREINLEAKEVADTKETEETEDDEVAPLIRRGTEVVIGRGVPKESDEEVLDHSKKLKGVAPVPAAAQSLLNLKKGSRASREEYILKQIPKGPSEGSTAVL